ncbi:sigma-70 family RNA polymerase sigma factor [Roseomonas frigidaquae]|uniref:Sigma-70 family RNA polymerase sigma factor n=1 Tax=Falsiroseomonas frigidaquae TaxID=487318 RepID=A0ABX1F7N2_9PROT|nr:sigma-70 family RNA polymerase sigma factor [Falsiroseomonas frigidaquae]NKE48330.1 sigma-70 family RNA polymerase sigma factor [Falsiroseomonas frigidaquae]
MQCGVDEQENSGALRAVIAQLLPELRAAARMLTRSRAEADDLVQETVLRMLRGLDGFVPPPELAGDPQAALRPWGLTVLRNTFREGWRKARRERDHAEANPPEAEASRQSDQESAHEVRDLARAVSRLPPAMREALMLVAARGLSLEAAAAICEVPVGTMKARVSRARAALSRALAPVNE